MKVKRNSLLPILSVFILFDLFFYMAKGQLVKWGLDTSVLIIANSLILILTLITFYIQQKALLDSNPNVFIRSIMAGMMIKMFACMIAIFVYWYVSQQKFSKPAVLVSMLMYVVYLVVEVKIVTKLNRQKNA